MIAADRAHLLQRPDAAEAGRRGQADALGEFDIGHPPVGLEMGEDLAVDTVQRHQPRVPPDFALTMICMPATIRKLRENAIVPQCDVPLSAGTSAIPLR